MLRWTAVLAAVLSTSCGGAASEQGAAAAEGEAQAASAANEAIARRIIDEAWNAGNFAVIDESFSPTHVSHANGVQDSLSGPEGAKQGIGGVRQEYGDLRVQIDDMISSGDKVAMRWTFTGTHAQLGKPVTLTGVWIGHFENGKLVQDWNTYDSASVVTQLGGQVVPPAAPASR
jgi:predicted ester cyclase